MTSAIKVGVFFMEMERGDYRINVPGKVWFHLAMGVFPIRYKKADVDGLVSIRGDNAHVR